ncbi:MAG: hypothetical protein JST04_13105 [Bdellovibrionales bacterium]|nr:hypothetical protein [Bdellovibrionales bacterium]
MRRQLRELQQFMTEPVVMLRQQARVEPATASSAVLSVLRFLGFCQHVCDATYDQLELQLVERMDLLERYVNWLLHERCMQPQSVMRYLDACVHVLKFLNAERARPNQCYRDIESVELMRQVRRQVAALVRFEPPTHEQLANMQRWLPWESVVKTLRELEQRYRDAPEMSYERARALMEFLMVGCFVYFPPVRAGPIRQLEVGLSLVPPDASGDGRWYLDLRKYKTYKRYGPLITELHAELVQPFEQYLQHYRPLLLQHAVAARPRRPHHPPHKPPQHQMVFVNARGQPFSTALWSASIQRIFVRHTGQRMSNNLLRDSFVTHVYSQQVSSELKASIAAHMGHQPQTAERSYNRATSNERRRAGLQLADQLVRQFSGGASSSPPSLSPLPMPPRTPTSTTEQLSESAALYVERRDADDGDEQLQENELLDFDSPMQVLHYDSVNPFDSSSSSSSSSSSDVVMPETTTTTVSPLWFGDCAGTCKDVNVDNDNHLHHDSQTLWPSTELHTHMLSALPPLPPLTLTPTSGSWAIVIPPPPSPSSPPSPVDSESLDPSWTSASLCIVGRTRPTSSLDGDDRRTSKRQRQTVSSWWMASHGL